MMENVCHHFVRFEITIAIMFEAKPTIIKTDKTSVVQLVSFFQFNPNNLDLSPDIHEKKLNNFSFVSFGKKKKCHKNEKQISIASFYGCYNSNKKHLTYIIIQIMHAK